MSRNTFYAFILLLLSACSPAETEQTTAATGDRLALLPDTLSTAALAEHLRPLPAALTDTFFRRRLLSCYEAVQPECLQRLLEQYRELRPDDAGAEATGAFFRGVVHQWGARYDSAELYYSRANEWFEKTTDTAFLARILMSRSGNYAIQGNLEKDIELKYKALYLIRNDSAMLMMTRSMLGNSLNKNADFEQAIQLLPEQALFYFSSRRDTVGWAYALTVLGVAHFGKNQHRESLKYLGQALALRGSRAPGISSGMRCESYYLYGRSLNRLGRYQEALDTLRVAEMLGRDMPNRQGMTILDLSLGEALFYLGRFEEARRYLRQSLEVSRQRNQLPSALASARLLYLVEKEQGIMPAALSYLEQYGALRDSIFSTEKEKIVRELSVQHQTREKEAEIEFLKIQNQLARQRNAWIAGSMLIVFGVLLFLYRTSVQRRQEKLTHEKELAEAQNYVMAKQLEIKDFELKAQRTRLEDYAKMLIDRNQRLQELSAAIQPSSQAPGKPAESGHHVWPGTPILTDADWEKFKLYFNSVYPDFVFGLKTKFPNLSSAELRLVMLAKMGLNTKESATILGISIDAVKKGRYRLRKKFDLSGEQLSEMP